MLWTLGCHQLTTQHKWTHCYAGYFKISVYTFLMEVCLNPIIYFSMIHATMICFSQWIPSLYLHLHHPRTRTRKTPTALVRSLHKFAFFPFFGSTPVHLLFRFAQVTQPSGFYFSKQEIMWMFSSNKFALLITSSWSLSWKVHHG